MSSKPKSATLTLDFMGISEDFKVDKDTTTQDLLDQAVKRFHLEKSNKTFDVFAVNIADNSELFSLRAAPFKPFELHLELESTVGKGKFEYSYHPVEANEIKQQKTQETNLKKSRSGRKEKNKSLKKHSSNNLRERSLSVGDIIEASLATKSTNKSPSRPLSSRSSRRRHGSLKQSSERRHRSSKKENDDDDAAPAAFVSLRSPRNADDEETNDSGFVHTLDKAQIKEITDKQYPKLINAPVTYAYRDDIEEWKNNKKLRKLYDDAVRKFNESGAKTTIEFLTEKKCGSDEDITQFLHECPQLEKGKVGDFLTNDNDEKSKSARVRKLFCEAIEMKDIDVLQALRRAISLLRIPGDAARLTRYLEAFADAYCKANPKSIKKPDNCFELAFVMLTLNTATHHPSAQARITDEKFQSMLANVVKGEKRLTKDDVSAYYDSIVTDEIRMPSEGLFLNVVRRGWVEVQETGGMFNKQNWRKRWAVLADNVFYLMKEPLDPPHWVIPLRDVLAMAGTVAGREHAFTLQPSEGDMIDFSEKEPEKGATAKRMASLSFAVPTKDDALRWVTSINESIDENRILVPDDDTQIISPRGTSSSHSSSRRRHSRRAK